MRFGLLTSLPVIAIVCSTTIQDPAWGQASTVNNQSSVIPYGQQQQQMSGPQLGVVGVEPPEPNPPGQPDWLPLTADHTEFIEKLLDHWQKSSDQVKQYKCDFMRWDYNPDFCNWRDPKDNKLAAMSVMSGQIRFATPDQARYDTTQVWDFDGPPDQPGDDPKYKARDKTENQERWICDGEAIYQFDFQNKKLYETDIPPEMQGKGLMNSPLPFFFGTAKKTC